MGWVIEDSRPPRGRPEDKKIVTLSTPRRGLALALTLKTTGLDLDHDALAPTPVISVLSERVYTLISPLVNITSTVSIIIMTPKLC